ncbi:MAG: NADH-quinone oxidoreductase subunit M, partial [Terracidiphilus sp.]
MLAWTIYISFAGAVLLALMPKGNNAWARWLALIVAAGGLALGVAGFVDGMGRGLETIVDLAW